MIQYDPRTIAFVTELIHLPMHHEPAALRDVYNRLGERNANWYMNFNVDPNQGGAQMVTMRPGAPQAQVSAVTLMPDRIQLQEEMTDLTLEEFLERVHAVAEICSETLAIPQFNVQQNVVRSLVTPRNSADSRQFIGERLCSLQGEQLEVMKRPVGTLGLRFMFPADEEDNTLYNVRVESYNFDVRSVYLEVAATFPDGVTAGERDKLSESLQATYDFMHDRLCTFVASFDVI